MEGRRCGLAIRRIVAGSLLPMTLLAVLLSRLPILLSVLLPVRLARRRWRLVGGRMRRLLG